MNNPDCPSIYHFKNTSPHIDEDGHHYLLAILSDLVQIQVQARYMLLASELRVITCSLGSVMARYEPKEGA